MKTFSEFLSAYVAEHQISWQNASQLCGVNRTLLSRYASGKQQPESMDKVEKIARGLQMTRQQAEEFKELYKISRGGGHIYKTLDLIDGIFLGQNSGVFPIPAEWHTPDSHREFQGQSLHGEREICEAVYKIAEESKLIRIQTDAVTDYRFLFPVLADSACRIEHIIRVSCGNCGQTAAEELNLLLPFFFLGKDYRVYCHYQWSPKTPETGTTMNIMLGSQGLLLFSGDFTRGIFSSQAECRSYYERIYLDNRKKCRVFGGSGQKEKCFLSASESSQNGERNLQEGKRLLKHPSSGMVFIYQNMPCERVWVQNKSKAECFYIEEAELVRQFQVFMDYARRWGDGVEDSGRGDDRIFRIS